MNPLRFANRTEEEDRRGRDEIWKFASEPSKFVAINSVWVHSVTDPGPCDTTDLNLILKTVPYRVGNIDCGFADLDLAMRVCDRIRDCNGILDSWRKLDPATRFHVKSGFGSRASPAFNQTVEYDNFYAAYFRTETQFRRIDEARQVIIGTAGIGYVMVSGVYGGLAVTTPNREINIDWYDGIVLNTTLATQTAITVVAFLLYFVFLRAVYGRVMEPYANAIREPGEPEEDGVALTELRGRHDEQVADGLPSYSMDATTETQREAAIVSNSSETGTPAKKSSTGADNVMYI
ncbi:hypothetical protein HDU96_000075 [Phlyctochytrium bullatum]|nr:hypothetical protein HDU96_000075 [Phlyctochytrium bullatum]